MLSAEIRETVMIAVGAIMLSSLLTFIVFLFGIREDLADVRNNQVYATNELEHLYQYNVFEEGELYGVDVVSTIRDYYDTGTIIRVNSSTGSLIYQVDKQSAKNNPNLVKTDYLSTVSGLEETSLYDVVLVYENIDMATVTKTYTKPENTGREVYGIVFFKR